VVISTSNAYGGTPKIYFYNPDPAVNSMVDSIQIAGWNDYGMYGAFSVVGDTLIGSHTSYKYYKINLVTKQLIVDTSFLYYAAGSLENGYIWFNTPAPGNCQNISTCGMPNSYMLRYKQYNAFPYNHIVYSITYDGYSITRTRGIYPVQSQNLSPALTRVNTFSAFPNPVNNLLTINGTGEYILISVQGSAIKREKIDGRGKIDVSDIAAGTYFLVNRTTKESRKIIILH